MNEFIENLLNADYSRLWVGILDVVQNPRDNTTAFILLLGGATILVLIVIAGFIALFLAGADEDEYGDEDDETATPAATRVRAPEPVDAATVARRQQREEWRSSHRALISIAWALAFLLVWVAGGAVTRRDATCLSCHLDGGIHATRAPGAEGADLDAHGVVRCVSCHETPSDLASVTSAVPGRAVHFIAGFLDNGWTSPYGVPVANRSCAGCHEASLKGTLENEVRGLRVSHEEPLDARALCTDCHAPHAGTGAVDRYTVGMEACIRCHDQAQVSAECTYCHTKDVSYAARARGVARPTKHVDNINCGSCHSEESCDRCHGVRMPHSKDYMAAGHARDGVEDLWFNQGRTCSRCHTATRRPCARCHIGGLGRHGVATWPTDHAAVDPYKNGCDGCHYAKAWVAGRNYCGICHPQWAVVK